MELAELLGLAVEHAAGILGGYVVDAGFDVIAQHAGQNEGTDEGQQTVEKAAHRKTEGEREDLFVAYVTLLVIY